MHEIKGNMLGLLYTYPRGLLRKRQCKLGVMVRNVFLWSNSPMFWVTSCSNSVKTFLIQTWTKLKVYLTFLTTTCKVRSLVAVAPRRAVLSAGTTPTVILSSRVWVKQWWFTIARLHFHTYTNRA